MVAIRGKEIKVFTDGSDQPDLVIKKSLGKKKSGNLALWGYNTYYKNLKISLGGFFW